MVGQWLELEKNGFHKLYRAKSKNIDFFLFKFLIKQLWGRVAGSW